MEQKVTECLCTHLTGKFQITVKSMVGWDDREKANCEATSKIV